MGEHWLKVTAYVVQLWSNEIGNLHSRELTQISTCYQIESITARHKRKRGKCYIAKKKHDLFLKSLNTLTMLCRATISGCQQSVLLLYDVTLCIWSNVCVGSHTLQPPPSRSLFIRRPTDYSNPYGRCFPCI